MVDGLQYIGIFTLDKAKNIPLRLFVSVPTSSSLIPFGFLSFGRYFLYTSKSFRPFNTNYDIIA